MYISYMPELEKWIEETRKIGNLVIPSDMVMAKLDAESISIIGGKTPNFRDQIVYQIGDKGSMVTVAQSSLTFYGAAIFEPKKKQLRVISQLACLSASSNGLETITKVFGIKDQIVNFPFKVKHVPNAPWTKILSDDDAFVQEIWGFESEVNTAAEQFTEVLKAIIKK